MSELCNDKQKARLVITVSGLHGSGRTTQALNISKSFGLRYISSGTVFRQLAEEKGITLEEMSKLTENDPKLDKMIEERTKNEAKQEHYLPPGQQNHEFHERRKPGEGNLFL